MTTPTYLDATTIQTESALEAQLLASLTSNGSKVAGWPLSAPQRALVKGEARAWAYEQTLRQGVAYTASPRTAKLAGNTWVDVALTWYQITRLPATYAEWDLPVKASAAVSPLTIPQGTSTIQLQAEDGTIFLGDLSAGALTVTQTSGLLHVIARLPGTTGNQIPGNITRIISGPAGLSVDLTRTQVQTVTARDEEGNDAAIERAFGRLGALSGVLTARGWKYVILTPDVGGVATLTRVFVDDANPYGPGSVGLSLANATGPATVAEVAAAQAQADALRIAGMGRVVAAACTELNVPLTAQLLTDGSNPLAASQAATALNTFVGALTGDWLYLAAVYEVLMGIAGVVNVPSLSLAADVERPSDGVITVTPTITQI